MVPSKSAPVQGVVVFVKQRGGYGCVRTTVCNTRAFPLTYADVCCRMQVRAHKRLQHPHLLQLPGTQFACFTSTKVQTLTSEELRART